MAGQAALANGSLSAAADAANAALAELRRAGEMARRIAPDLEALQGAFFLRSGQRERGRMMLREAIRQMRAEPGPDAWTFALFRLETIAREARQSGDWEFARYAADQMRDHDAAYGGTQYSLGLVAEHFGEADAAAKAYTLAVAAWKRADDEFGELADARLRLAALRR
jgi:hypothetical protein